jgi:hypothetical protein
MWCRRGYRRVWCRFRLITMRSAALTLTLTPIPTHNQIINPNYPNNLNKVTKPAGTLARIHTAQQTLRQRIED